MKLVTVYRTFSPADAQLVCSRLNAANLRAQVTGELSSLSMDGYSLATGGIRVQVPEEDSEQARELIAAKNSTAPPENAPPGGPADLPA